MNIFAVVLCWNSKDYISKCLTSFKKLKPSEYDLEVVVVDNDSTDGSLDFLKQKFPKFTYLSNSTNLGYAAGNNIGLKYSLDHGADFIWIVNPDVTLSPTCLSELISAAQRYPHAGIFTPKIYFAPGYEFHSSRYTTSEQGKVIWSAGGTIDWQNLITSHNGVDEVDIGQYNTDSLTQFATGASIFIRATVLQKIGLINPAYYLYYEENDLCQRAVRSGFQLMYIASAVCWHANAQATGIGSSLQDYYTTRNRLIFGFRWAPLRTKIALYKQSLKMLFSGRPWQKRGVLDFYLFRFGKGSYAISNHHH